MPAELPVHISREGLHTVEVPGTFEATDSFDIRLINHGNSLHVHLHLDDALSPVADLGASNHYVESDSERVVRVEVAEGREEDVVGRLKIVSAYGAETRWVDVELVVPDEEEDTVEVGESLSKPQPRTDPGGGGVGGELAERPELVVGAVGLAAVVVAGAAAAVLGDPLVLVGALVVFGGVAVALALLR